MFTGIVEELGSVRKISKRAGITSLQVGARLTLEGARPGDSVAVNGVCLTVVRVDKDSLWFEAMPETSRLTNIGSLRPGEKVNLERSLKIGDRLSGHFVTGHADCTGIIRRSSRQSGNREFEIAVPAKFLSFCLPKGSVSVDGISLTLMKKGAGTFSVYIIPHTFANTTLGFKGPSDKVNVEFDILAKR